MFLHPVMCSAVHVVPDGAISLFHLSPSSYSKSSSTSSSRRADGDKAGADIESLKKQLLIVDQRLATLTGRLEVLKAVQQVLPTGKPETKPKTISIIQMVYNTEREPSSFSSLVYKLIIISHYCSQVTAHDIISRWTDFHDFH
jgi:hypothetical protein